MNSFLTTIFAGTCVNLITATILWLFLDRRIKEKERKQKELRSKELEQNAQLHNDRLIKSELISQLPIVINTNTQMQQLAFNIANLRNTKISDIENELFKIHNSLRHITNTQRRLYYLLATLESETDIIKPFDQTANLLSVIINSLYRYDKCSNEQFNNFAFWFEKVKNSKVITKRNSPHWDRIEVLLKDLHPNCTQFAELQLQEKLDLFINISEALGHLSCLYADGILLCFEKEIKKLKEPLNP